MNEQQPQKSYRSELLGAAFLMATSAVGPGFLNNTALFTSKLLASFGFVILLSVIIDIFAQLNIWRVISVSGKPAQELAGQTLPGSGHLLSALIAIGGLAFNIGNIGGCALGLCVMFGLELTPQNLGITAIFSAIGAIIIFLFKEAGKALDLFAKILGLIMIGLIVYVCYVAHPPLAEAALRTIVPLEFDALSTVALVGGTVGGYISFAGAHRLLDAGVIGTENMRTVSRGATSGILITSLIRFLLFLAALGVVVAGGQIDQKNPAASVFQTAAGEIGYKIFGIVIFCAAITSVVGAAYTSVSFIRSFHKKLDEYNRFIIIGFIVVSTIVFVIVGQPAKVLVVAGILNGFILPMALALILLATFNKKVMGDYKHSVWLQISGWLVVLLMGGMSIYTMINDIGKLFQ